MAKRKKQASDVMCKIFHCDHYGDKYCCCNCNNPCKSKCLNSPDKCGLVQNPKDVDING